jgi:hypothetical protein
MIAMIPQTGRLFKFIFILTANNFHLHWAVKIRKYVVSRLII